LSAVNCERRELERVIRVLNEGPVLELHDRLGTCWRGRIRNCSIECLLVEAVRCEGIGDACEARLDEAIIDWVVEARTCEDLG